MLTTTDKLHTVVLCALDLSAILANCVLVYAILTRLDRALNQDTVDSWSRRIRKGNRSRHRMSCWLQDASDSSCVRDPPSEHGIRRYHFRVVQCNGHCEACWNYAQIDLFESIDWCPWFRLIYLPDGPSQLYLYVGPCSAIGLGFCHLCHSEYLSLLYGQPYCALNRSCSNH